MVRAVRVCIHVVMQCLKKTWNIHEIGLLWLHITLEKVSKKGAGNLPLLARQLNVVVAF